MPTKAQLFFQETPAAFRDTLGQSFEVDDLDDFLYTYSDALPGAQIIGDQLWYVNGTDADGAYTWSNAIVLVIPPKGGDGGVV